MKAATTISRMLSVLIALFLTAGCVQVTGAGKWSGTYSLECIPRAKLKSQVRSYDEQIQPLLAQSAQVQRRIQQDEFFLRYTIAREGNTGGCRIPKAGSWPKQPPFFACSPGDTSKPLAFCLIGSLTNQPVIAKGTCLAAAQSWYERGASHGLPPRVLSEPCEAYFASEGIKNAADLRASFVQDIGFALLDVVPAPRGYEMEFEIAKGVIALIQTGTCAARMREYCTNRYALYEFERKLSGRPEALRQACEEREASVENNRQILAGLEREVEALRRESAPIRQAFAEKNRNLRSQRINCGD